MAISGTSEKMDSTLRSNLDTSMSSDNYVNAVGGQSYNGRFNATGLIGRGGIVDNSVSGAAGIKENFATALDDAINDYVSELNKTLDKLETNPNVLQAFKGDLTVSAIQKLIKAVKNEAQLYTKSLREAEQAIIEQVAQLYQSQNQSVADSMNTDTNNLAGSNQTPSYGGGAGGGGRPPVMTSIDSNV